MRVHFNIYTLRYRNIQMHFKCLYFFKIGTHLEMKQWKGIVSSWSWFRAKIYIIIFFFCKFEARGFSWVIYANRLQSSSVRSTNLLRCDVHNHSFFLYLIDIIILRTILPLSFTVLVTHRMFLRNAFCIIHIKIFMTTFCFLCHRN